MNSPPNDVDEKKCPLTNWSAWSKCSKRCGPENRTRDRNFKKKRRKECRHLYPNAELQQTVDCDNPACDSIEGGSEAEGEETVSESTETTEATSETAESGATEESTPTETSSEPPPEGEDLVGAENRRQVTGKKRRRKVGFFCSLFISPPPTPSTPHTPTPTWPHTSLT